MTVRARLTMLVVAVTALVGALAGSAAAAQQVFVEPYLNQGEATVRPHEILLAEDGTLALTGISYQSYGGPTARATGRGYTRGCTPDCAQGKVLRPSAKIEFSRRIQCQGQLIYAKLRYKLAGPIPSGFKRTATYDLRPIDEHGKPLC
jgi:hypothetical protein